jgi:homocysteine S-methyltransferase
MARAAAGAGVPVAVYFTTETDGRLPDGTSLADAIAAVDAATGGTPVCYGVNCAHPAHFEAALPGGAAGARVRSVRANASRKSHAELDEPQARDLPAPELGLGLAVEIGSGAIVACPERPGDPLLGLEPRIHGSKEGR